MTLSKVTHYFSATHSSCVTRNKYACFWCTWKKRDTTSLLLPALCFLLQQCFNCAGDSRYSWYLPKSLLMVLSNQEMILLQRKRFYCHQKKIFTITRISCSVLLNFLKTITALILVMSSLDGDCTWDLIYFL